MFVIAQRMPSLSKPAQDPKLTLFFGENKTYMDYLKKMTMEYGFFCGIISQATFSTTTIIKQ